MECGETKESKRQDDRRTNETMRIEQLMYGSVLASISSVIRNSISSHDVVYSTFLRKLHPSVSLAFPPVGWHKTDEQEAQKTTVVAWENTVVI